VNEIINQQKEKIVSFWNKLSYNQKIFFCVGLAVIAVVAILLILFAGKPKYVPLYTKLDPQDAAAITEYLKEKKVLYKLENGGTTILVPEAQKYDLRLSLVNEGLPKGGSVGFESFDQARFGETESERRVRYLVALQGELERTIRKLDVLEDVRVHIVIPEPSLFLDKERDATAAVLVKLRSGYSLEEEQVSGIMHLVASGVEGMKPDNVTVVDTNGNILSGDTDTSVAQTAKLTTSQMQIERDFEKNLENSIKAMLEQIVGQGKTVVRVSAVLDFDRVEIRKETFGDRKVRSQQSEDENTSSRALQPEGTAGAEANIPEYGETEGEGTTSQSEITKKTTNYEIDKEDEVRVVAPGAVKQLSLSVVLDGEIDSLRQQEIIDLVSSAAGLQPERGDQLTVTSMPFDRSWAKNQEKEMAAEQRKKWMSYGLVGILFLGSIIIAILLIKKQREKRSIVDYFAGQRLTVDEVLATKDTQESTLSEEEEEKAHMIQQIQRQVRQHPEEVAQLLKAWLSEEQR